MADGFTPLQIDTWLKSGFGPAWNTAFGSTLKQRNPFSDWLGSPSTMNRYQNLYEGQLRDNPNWDFMEWITGLRNPVDAAGQPQEQTRLWSGVNPQNEFRSLAPAQRGQQTGKFAPFTKWLNSAATG